MAVTHITHTRNGQQALTYLTGKPHDVVNGHGVRNRMSFGIGCPNDIKLARKQMNAVWKKYQTKKNKSVEMYRYKLSWSKEELDPDKEEDIEKAGELARQFYQKVNKNDHRLAYIAIQTDGTGGNIHAHIDVQNQDYITGKCIRGDQKNAKDLQRYTDEVLHENGMQQPKTIKKSLNTVKSQRRTTMAEEKLRMKGQYVWKDDLRNRIDYAKDKATDWNSFIDCLDSKGVSLNAFKKAGIDSSGHVTNSELKKRHITYIFTDDTDKTRKARETSLGTDYDFSQVEQSFTSAQRQQQLQKKKQQKQEKIRKIREEFQRKYQPYETSYIEPDYTEPDDFSDNTYSYLSQDMKDTLTTYNNDIKQDKEKISTDTSDTSKTSQNVSESLRNENKTNDTDTPVYTPVQPVKDVHKKQEQPSTQPVQIVKPVQTVKPVQHKPIKKKRKKKKKQKDFGPEL